MMTLTIRNSMPTMATFLLSFIFLFFMACEDGEETPVHFDEVETSVYEAEESAENMYDVIESITTSAIKHSDALSGGRVAETTDPELVCATVDFTGTRQEGRIEINFGDGCEGPDGKVRKGIIVVEYSGHWLVSGSKIWTILKNFYVDGIKIEGTRLMTNVSEVSGTLVFTLAIMEGKVTWPDETFMTRSSERTHSLTFGDTLDEFQLEVEGTSTGVTKAGVGYMSETIEPLIFKSSCRGNTIYLPVSGIKTITIPEKPLININYGEGECDKKFRITIGEGSKEVSL
jgi:hypothetical protein